MQGNASITKDDVTKFVSQAIEVMKSQTHFNGDDGVVIKFAMEGDEDNVAISQYNPVNDSEYMYKIPSIVYDTLMKSYQNKGFGVAIAFTDDKLWLRKDMLMADKVGLTGTADAGRNNALNALMEAAATAGAGEE